VVLWYPELSTGYVQDTQSLHDGPITLADEQAQWTARKQKLAAIGVRVGPYVFQRLMTLEEAWQLAWGPSMSPIRNLL
jgi:hypothetical protein